MRQNEFCRSRGLSLSTLARHLKKRRWKRKTAYDQIGGPKMVHAACWSHARRYFFEAIRFNPKDPVATPIAARMDELFAIDAEDRHQQLRSEARNALRQERARKLLGVIREQIETARSVLCPPERYSKLATTYPRFGKSLPGSWNIPNWS
jgi:hypothetical protein